MHVLCHPSTDVPESIMIDDSGDSFGQEISITNNVAVGTYDFVTNPNHPDSKYITEGNYIAFKDKYHKHRLYTIMTIEGDDEWEVHCEDIGLDLLNEDASAWDTTGNPESAEETLNRALYDTGWSIGINEISDRKRATKYEGITDSQLARVGMIMNAFDAECDFEIEMKGSKVVKQEVNVYKSVGEDKTQQRFIDNINLISLRRSGSIEELCTCMRCYGKEDPQTGVKVTIADIVYDDGRYYSPKGHIRIYDREARNKWSRFRAYDYEGQSEFDGYINGTFEYDTDSAQELFNRGLSELKKRNEKKVIYEAKLYDIKADIGDTVQIADNKHNEKIYLSARVQSVKNHYCVRGEDTGVLANYKILESKPTSELEDMMEELKNQLVSVKTTVIEYQAGTSGTEIPDGTWVTKLPETQPGQYLWTRTTITYTNGSVSVGYSVSRNGEDGKPGEPGKDGIPGRTYYTWIKYADDEHGNGMSDNPDGKQYMGIANNKDRIDESLDPADYQWARITGEGIPGKPGADGKTYYTWVRYADDQYGNGMSDNPSGKYYIGLAFNKETQIESNNPKDYQWSKYRGDDGIPGSDGADGKTTYFHVKYSSVPNPTSSSEMTETPSKYIGTYVDFTMQDSTNPRDYTWSQFKGDPGENGIPGVNGSDGKTSYLHIAYANSSDGYTDFSTTNSDGKQYIGQYVDFTEQDSTNPYMYKWTKVKGENGQNGQDGEDGVGIRSVTKYYLASTQSTGITTNSYGWTTTMQTMTETKKYLWSYEMIAYTNGTYTKTTPIIIGVHGQNGADGENGIIVSPTPPENPKLNQLWQTASGQPIKRWDGSRWVIYYISVDNLNAATLSAISANLGAVTAATITNKRDGETAIILNSESIAFYDWANGGQYAGKISSGHIGGTSSQPELDIVSEGPLILSAEGYSYAFANDDLRIGDTAILEAINELNRKLNFRIVTKQKAISISNSNAFDVFLSSEVPGALFVAACIQNKTPDIWCQGCTTNANGNWIGRLNKNVNGKILVLCIAICQS